MSFIRLALAMLCIASLPAVAQYNVEKVVIEGGAPYTDAELLDVAGMQVGQMLTHSSLQSAAQHLLDTGVFDDAEVSLSGAGKGRTVHFALKTTPLAKMMPASFANLVWWTPAELAEGIHAHAPLYRGRSADAGSLPDMVQDALVKMLAAKGVTASVSHVMLEGSNAHPGRVMEFRVDSPRVVVQSANVSGVGPAQAADVQRMEKRLVGSAYYEGLISDRLDDLLLIPLRNAGYVGATMEDVKRDVSMSGAVAAVTYSGRVQPGEVYTVSGIVWSATPIFSAEDFAREMKMRVGDVASNAALRAAEQKIVTAYKSKGYLDAYVEATPKLDNAAHTVSYALEAHPGEQYRLRSVTPLHLSAAAQKDFDEGWRMKSGDVYDDGYVATFLMKNTALRNLAVYTAGFQVAADSQTHQVDLTINFVANNAR